MKRLGLLILAFGMVAALVAAPSPAAVAQDEVTITLMGWSSSPAENEALEEQVAAFEADNPNINVEINLVPEYDTTIQAAFASGDPPNVFYVDSFKLPDWAEAGVLDPGGDRIIEQDDIFPSLLEVFTYEEELYCAPKDFSTMALQYNKDLFDAAELDYPTADWTWEDLYAAAEALTNEDVLGLVTPLELPRWLPFLYQNGGAVMSEDFSEVTFNSDEAIEALEIYVGMNLDGIAGSPSEVDAGWGGEAFGEQRVAMAMEGNWVIQFLEDNYPELNYGVVELPAGPAGDATMVFTVCYGVAAENDHPEESWALANFLTGPEGQMMVAEAGFGVMPARQSVIDTWLEARGEEFEAFATSVEFARQWQFPVGFGDFVDSFNDGLQQAVQGDLLPEDVIEDSTDVALEILDR